MKEVLALVRCWSGLESNRYQVYAQNMANAEFDRIIEQVKEVGLMVSPIKRSMRTQVSEDGLVRMVFYYQRVEVEGTEEAIHQAKQRI